jgi:hypothetical protein
MNTPECLAKLPMINAMDGASGRRYITPYGLYPSVTTVLDRTADHTWLDEWRERVGAEIADRITKQSQDRGTDMHAGIEMYLRGEQPTFRYPMAKHFFFQVKSLVDKIEPWALEVGLYSDRLKIAGRCDCIGLYDSVPSIIDYKNSNHLKGDEDVQDYFLQETIYSICLYERTGLEHGQIVTIMATENMKPLLFVKSMRDYKEAAIERIRTYYRSIK